MNFPAQMMLSSKKKKQSHFRSVISDTFDGSILSLVQCLTCDRVRCTAHFSALEGATQQHIKHTAFPFKDVLSFCLNLLQIDLYIWNAKHFFGLQSSSDPL